MTRIPGPSLDQLDALGDDYAALFAQALVWVTRDVDLGTTPFPEDVGSAVRTLWAEQVDATLLPALGVGFEVGAAQVRVGIREAMGLTAAAWTDVPPLQDALAEAYLAQARNRLVGVGDELWATIREQLLEGMAAGEGVDELAARLVESAGLTEARAALVARSEVNGAANAGALAQVRATGMTGTKTWLAAHDTRVRIEHEQADEETVPLGQPFTVGGFPADRPHDPSLPPHLSCNCRCAMSFELDMDSAELEPSPEPIVNVEVPPFGLVEQRQDQTFLERVFSKGLSWVARWLGRQGGPRTASAETGGDLGPDGHRQPLSLSPTEDRPAQAGARAGPGRPSASGAEVQPMASRGQGEVAGGDEAGRGDVLGERRARASAGRGLIAAAEENTGAMVALVPSEADLDRLVLDVDGAEPREELHLTLAFLGEAENWTPEQQGTLVDRLWAWAALVDLPYHGEGFGANHWNTDSDSPSWNLAVGGQEIDAAHNVVWAFLDAAETPEIPEQHAPFAAHVCLIYSPDSSLAAVVAERVGPITFDRLRVAFGEDVTDLPLQAVAEVAAGTIDNGGDGMTAQAEQVDASSPVSSDGAWEGVLVVEGTPTGDGRQFAQGALTWAELPLPLKWQESEAPGHDGAVIVGRIDKITREGNQLIGRGVFDLDGENGREAHRLVSGRFLRGVSIMPDDISDSDVELVFPEGAESDDLAELFAMPELMIFHAGRVRSATLCAEAAFVEAEVRLTEAEAPPLAAAASVASLDGYRPPAEWFTDPGLQEPSGIMVTEAGRIYGHTALWTSCHIGFGEVECVSPPQETDHPYFLTGEVVCANGERVPVGQVTLGTGHAPMHHGARAAAEHYDDTGVAVADVTVGNDEHGIWVAGAIRPGTDEARVYELQASGQLSGDWRRIGGQLRLVALLAVNVPGFPVPRTRARVASGGPVALVAAGRVTGAGGAGAKDDPPGRSLRSVADRIALSIGRDVDTRRAELVERVHAGRS